MMEKLIEGLTNADIASDLGISFEAVKQRIANISKKTGARNRIILATSYLRQKEEQRPRLAALYEWMDSVHPFA